MTRVLPQQCLPFSHTPQLQLGIDPGSPAYMAVAQHQHPCHTAEIEMKYVSQITGFDLNCKERLEMVSLGVALSPWQDVPDTAEPCQDTLDNHIKGNKHNKERLKKKERLNNH